MIFLSPLWASALAVSFSFLGLAVYADETPRNSKIVLESFPYADVQVTGGPMAAQTKGAREFYLAINEDSLLQGFRLRAGLPAPGKPMGGWYDPEDFAGGHSFGQYVSALARYYANTGDERFKEKVTRLVHGFDETIASDGFFYSSEKVSKDWPCYVYDKNATGMRDAYSLTGNKEALVVLRKMTDWAEAHLPRRSDEWYTLSQGLYLDYELTKEPRYLRMAKEYDYSHDFFDLFAEGQNAFTPDRHAYSHVNSLSSATQAYEFTGASVSLQAIKNAWKFLTSTQMFATGGWGPDEHFVTPGQGRLAESLHKTHQTFETPCGSYANVNFSRNLLRFTGEAKYGDNMERVLVNGMLSALPMRSDGHTFYYSDYSPGAKKDYFPYAWPCCSGTYAQITADYPLNIYFHDPEGIYVNIFAESVVRWKARGETITLAQKTQYPVSENTSIRVHLLSPARFALHVRMPDWLKENAVIKMNGHPLSVETRPGTFLALTRTWKDGDRLDVSFPRSLRFESIAPETPDRASLLYGPVVLVALAGSDVDLIGDIANPEQWIKPVPGTNLQFISEEGTRFKPLYLIKDEHYTTYPSIHSKPSPIASERLNIWRHDRKFPL